MATNNKYDRQLRLWGANGQKALAESCIILINATAAGTESLKNLVLPGIGSFHIIDDQIVNGCSSDSKNPFSNFFVFPDNNDDEQNNTSRAEIATKHLLELNPDVKGSYTSVPSLESADYVSIFQSIRESHKSCNFLVITADLPPNILRSISKLCWEGANNTSSDDKNDHSSYCSVPLVAVKSYGLIGTVRLQTPLHTIVESKPDNSLPDLRLIEKDIFPELSKFIQPFDLSSLDNHTHGHVPFVIILVKAMEKWLLPNESGIQKQPPKTFSEKQDFKKMIESMSRNYSMELNFQEAVDNASLVYVMRDSPFEEKELEELLSIAEERMTNSGTSYDVLLVALKQFMNENKGCPPLNGSIPDMTASTNYYIQLQNIYKTKAQDDEDKMRKIIQTMTEECSGGTLPVVSDEELSIFCKNVYNLRLTRTRSYESEYDFVYSSDDQKKEIQGELIAETFEPYSSSDAQTPLLWFIALRAADAFYDEYGHYPGKDSRMLALNSDVEAVQEKLKDIVEKMGLKENDLITSTLFSKDEELKNAFATEITRYHNAEIHNIASVVGGIASQEAVKLVTKQYVPMNGTYVYNGIAGVAGVYQF